MQREGGRYAGAFTRRRRAAGASEEGSGGEETAAPEPTQQVPPAEGRWTGRGGGKGGGGESPQRVRRSVPASDEPFPAGRGRADLDVAGGAEAAALGRSTEEVEYATLVRYMLLLLGAWHLALELLRRALLAFRIVQVDATGRLVTPGAESLTAELAAEQMVCAITFATALVITLLSLSWTTNLGRRSLALRASVVNYIALVTYASQWSGHMPSLVHGWSGWDGQGALEWASPLRYLQWAFTTPVLLSAISSLSGPLQWADVARPLAWDQLMLWTGFAESLVPLAGHAGTHVALFSVSSFAFVAALTGAREACADAEAAYSTPDDLTAIRNLWRHTILSWSAFPAARIAALAGLLSPVGLEHTYGVADVVAKMVYCCLIMACQFRLIEHTTQRRLARAEELLERLREQEGPSELAEVADGLRLAFREAEVWRKDRALKLAQAGVPAVTASVFLDAAVSEYVALAHGRLGSLGLPTLQPAGGQAQ